ncbi:MAG: ATP-dependent DNA helicase RecQ [Bacteroidota bacterium]
MSKIDDILLKYWGYNKFRPLQEEIITSVLAGNDTLALLPTGGGKSICFQVPAMAIEGRCLVISPLIALMKDQVENLNKRGIKAAALYTGMHPLEIERTISTAVFGDLKFLYVSPERLQTDLMKANISQMNITLIAVDEAHCISQWGYDFRPPYLRIAEIRDFLPKAPIIALTATATPKVVLDIQEKLLFKRQNLFQKSFERSNLIYFVIKEEDKLNRLLRIAQKMNGTAVVYVRNRRKTQDIAAFLVHHGISADFYHAGMTPADRDRKQSEWINGKMRIMVATNAFGMGIDKADVRFVVHLDIPDNVEAYFQEAGRGGRDEKEAWAILLYENADIIDLKHNFDQSFPDIDTIRNVYHALGNYYQIPVGAGKNTQQSFDLAAFCSNYNLNPIITLNSIKFLARQGILFLSEDINKPSRIFIPCSNEDFYAFQISHKSYDSFLKLMLRSYGGLFNDFTRISESDIAKRLNTDESTVISMFNKLEQLNILIYDPQTTKPKIIFLEERIDAKNLQLDPENYQFLKDNAQLRLNAILGYIDKTTKCRSRQLLNYFGESTTKRCGKCDVCLQRNKLDLSEYEFDEIEKVIKPVLKEKSLSLEELIDEIDHLNDQKIIKVINWLIDNNKIDVTDNQKLYWKK